MLGKTIYSFEDDKLSKLNIVALIKRKPGVALTVAYLSSVVILVGALYYIYKINGFVDAETKINFFLSFSASLLEDLVFFFLIGIIIFIITLKRMEDNEIDVRLDTVINSPNVTASAREFFRSETKSVLAFYEKYDVLIKIMEYNEEVGAYKIYLSVYGIIDNMCEDVQFNVQTNAFVETGVKIDDSWGELTIFYIKDIISGKSAGEPIGIPIQLKEKGYNKTTPLLISKSGKAEYRLGFGVWSKYNQKDDLFLTSVDRFVDSYNLIIENGLEEEVSFEFSAKIEYQNELHLQETRVLQTLTKLDPHNHFQLMKGSNLKPEESIRIFFGKPIRQTNIKGDNKNG